jgi:hypothetical protein
MLSQSACTERPIILSSMRRLRCLATMGGGGAKREEINCIYPLDRMLCGSQSRSGKCGEENILDPTRTRIPTPPSSNPQPVAIPTALSRLLFP